MPTTNPSFPQWTTEITNNFVLGEDMLGVEGAAQSYQQWLIPGIISTTDHARYYSFYAWVLYRYIHSQTGNRLMQNFLGKYYKRHEVALILGAYSHHIDGNFVRGLTGAGNNYSKVRSWWDTSDPVSLDTNYFQNELGGFGQYYITAMFVMGIIGDSENPSWVYPLTHRGEALAIAYENSIKKTRYFKRLLDAGQLESLSHKDAANYGNAGCICSQALSQGEDLSLLREAFFRFDQTEDDSPHKRRRFALAVSLDLVRSAKGKFNRDMLRPALYLGEYAPGVLYQPTPELEEWAFRWKMVAVRHQYTFGLQAIWGAFILHLRTTNGGLSLSDFMEWAKKTLGSESFDAPLGDYLGGLCKEVGLADDWKKSHSGFNNACRQSTELDEYSLYLEADANPDDSETLLTVGVRSLLQFYLRFLGLNQQPRDEWSEMVERERLPISSFFEFVGENLAKESSLGQWLEHLNKEFILSQHEFVALEKMRYQNYDTFKFYYREGRFYWPFNSPDYWREPIRLAGNRLNQAISILLDLGLVQENEDGLLSLTEDGKKHLARTVEAARHGN